MLFQFFASFCLIFSFGHSQNLTAVKLNAVMPPNSAISNQAVWYDGEDSVYIFGGRADDGTFVKDIFKYSITSDQIEKIGELPDTFSHGKVEADNFGNIYALGGVSGGTLTQYRVYKFNLGANTSEIVDSYTSNGLNLHPVIKPSSSSNLLLILGDIADFYTLKEFDMETHIFRELGEIPIFLTGSVGVRFDDRRAFIFTGYWGSYRTVWELDLVTLEFKEILDSHVPTTIDDARCGFSDGEFIYIVGGFHDIDWAPPENHPQNGILRFDPALGTTTFAPVDNWPNDGYPFASAPQCVYVDKERRMYCFGGFVGYGLDNIFYVDLSESFPTTEAPTASTPGFGPTFCVDLPNGLYPHPNDCTSFISCWDEELYQLFCPEGTFYSPNIQNCGDVNYCQIQSKD